MVDHSTQMSFAIGHSLGKPFAFGDVIDHNVDAVDGAIEIDLWDVGDFYVFDVAMIR